MFELLVSAASAVPGAFDVRDNAFVALIAIAFSVYVAAVGYFVHTFASRGQNLPPGPPTVPILGNLLIFPRQFPQFKFTDWAKVYGDAFSLKLMNKTMIVVNTPTLFKELIEKRAATTSNRPASILADMLTPDNMNLGTGRYANDTWKAMRFASVQLLNNENMKKYREYQFAEATQLLWDFAHTPDAWYNHIQRFTTSFAMGIIYGKRAPRISTSECAAFLNVQPQFMHLLELGTAPPVDLFPILAYVPEKWAPWKRSVKHVKALHDELYGNLLETVRKRLESGRSVGGLMEKAIQRSREWKLDSDDLLRNLGGTLLEGSDTSSATLQGVVLALVSFPECQRKLHEEIDRVVGSDRAPTWEDIPNLPYLLAFIEECNRFRPVGPLGLPHEMDADEVIDGILYPKGAIIFVNIWHMLHDERYFDRPEDFLPERFLNHPFGVKDGVEDDPARRANYIFGGGRRVCPGIAFAKTSMEINIANFVWAFNFLPALDPATKKPAFPSLWNYATGITATPLPFKCRIEPRSQQHVELIQMQFTKVAEHLTPFELEISADDAAFNRQVRDTI